MTLNLCIKDLSRQLSAQIDNPSKDKCLVVSVLLFFKGNLAFRTLSKLFTLLPHISDCYQLFASSISHVHPLLERQRILVTIRGRGNMAVCIYTPFSVFSVTYETYGREKFYFSMNVGQLDLVGLSAIDTHFKWKM